MKYVIKEQQQKTIENIYFDNSKTGILLFP